MNSSAGRTRCMRWLILAFLLSAGFVAFVVVAAVTSGPEASPDDFRQHAPESKDEKAAARAVITYVDSLILERPDRACLVVAQPMATLMRCATRPRIARDMQMGPTGDRPRVAHISLSGDEGHAWITNVSPGPLEDVSLRRVGTAWRVVGKSGAFGLA
jgi:hypothetical protein